MWTRNTHKHTFRRPYLQRKGSGRFVSQTETPRKARSKKYKAINCLSLNEVNGRLNATDPSMRKSHFYKDLVSRREELLNLKHHA